MILAGIYILGPVSMLAPTLFRDAPSSPDVPGGDFWLLIFCLFPPEQAQQCGRLQRMSGTSGVASPSLLEPLEPVRQRGASLALVGELRNEQRERLGVANRLRSIMAVENYGPCSSYRSGFLDKGRCEGGIMSPPLESEVLACLINRPYNMS